MTSLHDSNSLEVLYFTHKVIMDHIYEGSQVTGCSAALSVCYINMLGGTDWILICNMMLWLV